MALLLRNVRCVVSCDGHDNVYEKVDIFIRDGVIEAIGKDLDVGAEKVINCTELLCYPGLVNTHHHFYQLFSRNLPDTQGLRLFDWLTVLYDVWKRLDPEAVYLSTKCALALLMKSGCTTAFDHHYVFPGESSLSLLEAQFAAAEELGARFCASRGSMDLSKKDGGLPPDSVVQTIERIMNDSMAAVETFHDPSPGSMRQVALAPCSPFSASRELYSETAKLARSLGVRLHTHLCETREEEYYTQTAFKMRPLEYMQSMDFVGDDVWFAHGVWFNDEELRVLRDTGTGISHCPTSNMKLASGTARIPDMLQLGVPLSLGVDGSASNDGSDMIAEMRQAYLLSRLVYGNHAPDAYDWLKIATLGGAKALGRDDIGSIEIGKRADLFLIDKRRLDIVGAAYSPKTMLAAVGLSDSVDYTIVNGEITVEEGRLKHENERHLFEQCHRKIKQYLDVE